MNIVLYFFILIFKTGLQKDIKDLTFQEIVRLSQDTTQIRPYDVTENDVRFFLFTRTQSNLQVNSSSDGIFGITKPVKFIVHGYIENHERSWYTNMTNEYLKYRDFNVIQVDWGRPSRSSYVSAAFNTKFVGYFIADFIMSQEIPLEKVHIIGHSLGSHVAGFAGKRILSATGQQIYRITGLDPAGPYFKEKFITENDRLNINDAIIVDNIHTDAGFYGFIPPIGSLDMYINGGSRIQPGCIETFDFSSVGALIQDGFCSHARSVKYFIESINEGKFHCRKCDNWVNYKNGACNNNEEYVLGAEDVTTNHQGVCFADTRASPPFLQPNS